MKAQRSFFWSMLQFVTVFAIELGGLLVLSRLLTPTDMGHYAVAFAIAGLGQFIGSFALNTFIIRSDDMARSTRQKVAGVAFAMGPLMTLALAVIALLSWNTALDATVSSLLLVMAAAPLLGQLGTIEGGLLTREMRFRAIFVQRLLTTLSFQAVAIPLALWQFGAISLACGLVVSTLVNSVISTVLTRGAFLVRPTFRGLHTVTRFSSIILTTNIFGKIGEAVVPVLIGQLATYAAVGHFSRASELIRHAQRVVQDGVLPALMPLVLRAKRDGAALKPLCLQTLAYLTALCWPIAGTLIVLAEPLVFILLGDQWEAVPVLLRLLAVGIIVLPVISTGGVFALALGLERRLLHIQVGLLIAKIGIALLFIPAGLPVFCAMIAVMAGGHAVVSFWIVLRRLDVTGPDLAGAVWRSGVASLAFALPLGMVSAVLTGTIATDFAVLASAGCVAALLWLVALVFLNHPIRAELARILPMVRTHPSKQAIG
ncbi:MAG: oligosaccharide flippase family protein [Alphaproteobacteria bacterium]